MVRGISVGAFFNTKCAISRQDVACADRAQSSVRSSTSSSTPHHGRGPRRPHRGAPARLARPMCGSRGAPLSILQQEQERPSSHAQRACQTHRASAFSILQWRPARTRSVLLLSGRSWSTAGLVKARPPHSCARCIVRHRCSHSTLAQ